MSRELHETARMAQTIKCRRSLMADARDVERVGVLIELGARIQLLEAMSNLPRERLTRIYKEVRGESPPKGMLPFSTDWFVTWQPNIHGSLFLNLYRRATRAAGKDNGDALILAYRLYREQVGLMGVEPLLSITRAWRLVRFVEAGMLTMAPCSACHGQFIVHAFDLLDHYRCGLCSPPSRAGHGKSIKRTSSAVDEAVGDHPLDHASLPDLPIGRRLPKAPVAAVALV